MPKIYTLVKVFNKKKYADNFINGKLYSNSISYFKQIEDGSYTNRNDRFEAVSASYQAQSVTLTLNNRRFTDLMDQVILQKSDFNNLNIFCMYAIHSGDLEKVKGLTLDKANEIIKIDKDCLKLGNYAVVITDVKEFIERIKRKINKEKYGLKAQLVSYYNVSTFNGSFSDEEVIFMKRDVYQHQKEYRFVFETNNLNNEPLELDIGDISDITMSITTADINDKLKIEV